MSPNVRFSQEEIIAEIKRRTLLELKRRDPDIYADLIRESIIESLHDKQREVVQDVEDGHRFLALCTSRRAGKTTVLAALIVLTLLRAGHNQTVLFVASTLQKGRELIWLELERFIKEYHLDWKCSEHHGTILTPAGARFKILGLSTKGKAEAPRGGDVVAAFVDEVQDSEHLLAPLLTAIGPALVGRGGILVLSGTPGYQPIGTWHDIAEQGKYGFKRHHFTILDNPKLERDPHAILQEELTRNTWTDQTPEFLREYRGLWVPDTSSMVFAFHPERNSIVTLPDDYSSNWVHAIGIDLAFQDHSAWCVLALDPRTQRKVVVHAESHPGLFQDQQAEITRTLVSRFMCHRVVCDPAAGGLGFYEQFNAQYGGKMGVTIRSANKVNKPGRVAQVNSELRAPSPGDATKGRLVVLRPQADGLALEMQKLRYRNKDTCDFLTSKTIRDDISDCLMYALVELMPITAPATQGPQVAVDPLARLFSQNPSGQETVEDIIRGHNR